MAELTINLLRILTSVSAAADRPASYSNQIISSTWPSCWIQILTAMRKQHCGQPSDVYNTDWQTKLTALETISRWRLLKKLKISLFEPPFRALRGNVRTPSMARWKARGQLYIRRSWTFFAISYGWDVMSRNRSKSAFFERGWVTLSADFRGKGASPTNHCWYQSNRVIALSCGIKISAVRHFVLSQSTLWQTDRQIDRQTDGQTDRQNYDSQDRPRICSRGKNSAISEPHTHTSNQLILCTENVSSTSQCSH